MKKISNGRVVSLRGVQNPTGVSFLNGHLFTSSFTKHQIYQGENFELIAGSGNWGHNDGALLKASFQFLRGMVGSNGILYVADSENHCIRRISFFVEWTPQNHQRCDRKIRYAVRTLFLNEEERQYSLEPTSKGDLIPYLWRDSSKYNWRSNTTLKETKNYPKCRWEYMYCLSFHSN